MNRRRHVLPSTLALVCGGLALVAAPGSAGAAATTCQGKPVTLVASTTVTQGTEGDDVVAMEPDQWSTFDAKGGNDTICMTAPRSVVTDHYGSRDRLGAVDAGPGNDLVVDEAAVDSAARMVVALGEGDDVFTGSGVHEEVHPDASLQGGESAPAPTGPAADVVSGAEWVWSTAPADGLNADRVSLAGRDPRLVYRGAMSPLGLIDVQSAPGAQLELPAPGETGPVPGGELHVDNVARRATVGAFEVLRWTGEIALFTFGEHPEAAAAAVSFQGNDADESVTFADAPVGDVRLGGGDDRLRVDAYNNPFVPRSADGGAGADSFSVTARCRRLTIQVHQEATACDGDTGSMTAFEEVYAAAEYPDAETLLVGTSRSDDLVATGQGRVEVRGRGGNDDLHAGGLVTRVWGGPGDDKVSALGDNTVIEGQSGADRLQLSGSPGYMPVGAGTPPRIKKQVAVGGKGRDVLIGTADKSPDRLLGGPGRDRADGRKGRRDLCRAEVVRNCERS